MPIENNTQTSPTSQHEYFAKFDEIDVKKLAEKYNLKKLGPFEVIKHGSMLPILPESFYDSPNFKEFKNDYKNGLKAIENRIQGTLDNLQVTLRDKDDVSIHKSRQEIAFSLVKTINNAMKSRNLEASSPAVMTFLDIAIKHPIFAYRPKHLPKFFTHIFNSHSENLLKEYKSRIEDLISDQYYSPYTSSTLKGLGEDIVRIRTGRDGQQYVWGIGEDDFSPNKFFGDQSEDNDTKPAFM